MMMIIILLLADSEAQFPEKDRTKLRVPNQELAMMVCRGSKGFEILVVVSTGRFGSKVITYPLLMGAFAKTVRSVATQMISHHESGYNYEQRAHTCYSFTAKVSIMKTLS